MERENNIALLGSHEYDKPLNPLMGWGNKTFSVGIYKWLIRTNGKSLKRSKAIVRVSGPVENPEKVYERADEIITALNNGSYSGKHNVTVR